MPHFAQVEDFQEATQWQFPPMRMTAPKDTPYRAAAVDSVIGPMMAMRVSCSRTRLRRSPPMISSGDEPYLKVILHRRGTLVAAQDDRRVQVSPGGLLAFDTSRPYELAGLDPCDLIVIGMPRSMAGPSADLISRQAAVPVAADHGIRSVIAAFFSGLARENEEVHGPGGARLADAAASLLITAFSGLPPERVESPTGLAEQILSYALANLHDPGLSAGAVARRFGISLRYLHALMRTQDVRFSAWVRSQRLKRIRQDLLDPRLSNWTVGAVAVRWGIHDPAHLSRALRAEFGHSAAEIRASAAGR
ncbi:MAG: helix-turn-helix domain-containing protein [Streptosporangiales bacterium]|nr:helix-turn-helix domain-containing protein [Streptosporangiales bacterium]